MLMHKVGEGYPDAEVAKNGEDWKVEFKNNRNKKKPGGWEYTEAQIKFREKWQGRQIHTLVTEEDALKFPHE